jgi:hypothetical protein
MNVKNIKYIWAEDLPNGCPPTDAVVLEGIYYRLVESFPPTEKDFWSQRKLFPSKTFRTNECIARACSMMTSLEDCIALRKLPTHRHKQVVEVLLSGNNGVGKKTGSSSSHFSWWRTRDFNPLPCCKEVV